MVSPKVAASAAEAAIKKLDEMRGNPPTSPTKSFPPKSPTKQDPLEKAASAAFGSAAAKSHVIALNEELEMQKATRILIETQLKKMELKLAHFQEMEACLEHERKEIERERHLLYLDRLAILSGNAPKDTVVEVDAEEDVDMDVNITKID
jgi:SWI/SNF related-matrix-associated actin-dependent regulator of chromatin subfamily C